MKETRFREETTLAEMITELTSLGCNAITRVLPDKEETGLFIVEWE